MALFGATKSYIGLDLGGSTLKAVELIDRHKRIELSTYVAAEMPDALSAAVAAGPGDAESIAQAATAVREIFDAADMSADAVVASLPATTVFSVSASLPDLPDDDVARTLRFAVKDLLPVDVSSTFLIWSRHGEPPHTGTVAGEENAPVDTNSGNAPPSARDHETVPVFVTAVPKQVIEYYTAVLHEAQLEPIAFEPEVFPLQRSLLARSASAQIVDLGERTCSVHLVERGVPQSSQALELGLVALNDATQLQGFVERTHSAGSSNQQAMQQIVLTGGRSLAPGVLETWSQVVGREVMLGSPWHELSYPEALGARVAELGPQFALAIGLAQRELKM